jgi:hypothetical protein
MMPKRRDPSDMFSSGSGTVSEGEEEFDVELSKEEKAIWKTLSPEMKEKIISAKTALAQVLLDQVPKNIGEFLI